MVCQCDVCSAEYLAKRRSSRFCSDRCRKRAQRGAATLTGHARVVELAREEPSALIVTVSSELQATGRLNSSPWSAGCLAGCPDRCAVRHWQLGRCSVKGAPGGHGHGLEDAQLGADPFDQLRARRLRKLGLM
jgi:hypothetical protein